MEETTNAMRVGARIRKIRNLRHLSQQELGEKVGLTADRIQKYENGARTPRMDVMENIADALDCSIYALMDPVVSTPLGAMFALFEMESVYGLTIKKDMNGYVFSISNHGNSELASYLAMWVARIEQNAVERANIKLTKEKMRDQWNRDMIDVVDSYHLWEAGFPDSVSDEMRKLVKKQEIADQIEKLKQQMADLDS